MLNIFKSMRQKIIKVSNLKRYLLYAIGEILLVMIGILLALQVNNWNENRKNTSREYLLLHELNLNLNSNIENLNQNIAEQKQYLYAIDYILDHLENKKAYNDSLGFYFRRLLFIEQMTLSTSAYETLKSIGFDLIGSDQLRMAIIQLFEVSYPNASNLIKDVAMQRYSVTRSMYNTYFRTNRNQEAIPMDYPGLQQNEEFINWIYNRRAWKSSVIGINQDLIEPTRSLIKDVDHYLGH